MTDIVERLQNWRNKDQADAIVLTRGDIITLLTEIEHLRALLRAIMDDTSDGQESMSFDIRDRIERALEPKP